MLFLMWLVMPAGVNLLFTTAPGWAILLIAAALAGSGVYIANRITRSEI
jgi:Flp pilus assembly protein TadB